MRGRLGYGWQPHMVFGEEGRWWRARINSLPLGRVLPVRYCVACARARAHTSAGNEMPTHGNRYISKVDLCICILIHRCCLKFLVYR